MLCETEDIRRESPEDRKQNNNRQRGLPLLMTALTIALVLPIGISQAATTDVPAKVSPGAVQPDAKTPQIPSDRFPQLEIPVMKERPFDVDEGPRVQVQRFIPQGEVEPLGRISRAEIENLLEEQRNLRPDGFTVGQMQLVADAVTDYYRARGFILAKAYVPAQAVQDNNVVINIVAGTLGQVTFDGNNRYSSEILQKPFDPLLHKPLLFESVESALLEVMEYPGLEVSASFRPGQEEGTTELNLKVEKESLVDFMLSLDNYGSVYTGEYRGRADVSFNNPTGGADTLTGFLLDAFSPNNTLYGGLLYERPLPFADYTLGLGYNKNTFDVGKELEVLEISGTTENYDLYVERSIIKTRKLDLATKLDFSRKNAAVKFKDDVRGEDDLSVLSAAVLYNAIDTLAGGGINIANFSVSNGFGGFLGAMDAHNDQDASRTGASGDKAGGSFFKVNMQYSRLQRLWPDVSALVRLEGQWSNDLLVSIEQYSLGGPNSVRAYPQAEVVRDSGYFTALELIFNAPGFSDQPAFFNKKWGELLQFSMFIDYARGTLNDPLPGENEKETLSGAGLGLRFVLPGQFLANLTVAKPFEDREESNERDYRTFFSLTYKY